MALGAEPALIPFLDEELSVEHALCEVRCVASGCIDCCSTTSSRSHPSRCSSQGIRPASQILGHQGGSGSGVVAYVTPGHSYVSGGQELPAWGQPQMPTTTSSAWEDDSLFDSLEGPCTGLLEKALASMNLSMATATDTFPASDIPAGPPDQPRLGSISLDPQILYQTAQELSDFGADAFCGQHGPLSASLTISGPTAAISQPCPRITPGQDALACESRLQVRSETELPKLSAYMVMPVGPGSCPRQPLRSCSGGSNRSSPASHHGGGGDEGSRSGPSDSSRPTGGASSSTCASGSSRSCYRDTADSGPQREGTSGGGASGGPPSRHLWLGNLLQNVDSHAVEVLFTFFGPVQSVRVFPSKPSSFAFVNYSSVQSAMAAKAALEGQPVPSLTGIKPLLIRYQQPHQHLRLRSASAAATSSPQPHEPADPSRLSQSSNSASAPPSQVQGQGASSTCQIHGQPRHSSSGGVPAGEDQPGQGTELFDEEDVDLTSLLSSLNALGLVWDGCTEAPGDAAPGALPVGRVLSGSLPSGIHGLGGGAAGAGGSGSSAGASGSAVCTCTAGGSAAAAATAEDAAAGRAGLRPSAAGAGVGSLRRGSSGGGRGDVERLPELNRSLLHSVPSRHMWLGNIVSTAEVRDIEAVFGPFGPLESVRLFPDRNFAFVNFTAVEHAAAARKALHGIPVPRLTGILAMEIRFQHRGVGPRGQSGPSGTSTPPITSRGMSAASQRTAAEQLQHQQQQQQFISQQTPGYDFNITGSRLMGPLDLAAAAPGAGMSQALSREGSARRAGGAPSSTGLGSGSGGIAATAAPMSLAEALMCLAAGDAVSGGSGEAAAAAGALGASPDGADAAGMFQLQHQTAPHLKAIPQQLYLEDPSAAMMATPRDGPGAPPPQVQQAFLYPAAAAGGSRRGTGSSGSAASRGHQPPPLQPATVQRSDGSASSLGARPAAAIRPSGQAARQEAPAAQSAAGGQRGHRQVKQPAGPMPHRPQQDAAQEPQPDGGRYPSLYPGLPVPAQAALLQHVLPGGTQLVPGMQPAGGIYPGAELAAHPQALAQLRGGMPPAGAVPMLPQSAAMHGAGPSGSHHHHRQMAAALMQQQGAAAAGLWDWALQASVAAADVSAVWAAGAAGAPPPSAVAGPDVAGGWPLVDQPGLLELVASQQYLQGMYHLQQQQQQQQSLARDKALMAALVSQQAAAGAPFQDDMAAAAAAAAAASSRPGSGTILPPGPAAGQRRA